MEWYWWVVAIIGVTWCVNRLADVGHVNRQVFQLGETLKKQGDDIVHIENMLHDLKRDLRKLPAVLEGRPPPEQD